MAPPDLTRQLQAELDRVGCNPGTIDGVWGEKGRGALERFARQAKLSIATGEPTLAALEALKGQQGRICPLECGPSTVERSGQCVATGAPERAQPKAKAAPNAAPRPKAARRKGREKPGMCWAQDGRVTTILPCDDPRATIRAY
jgi:peptidoglycan hydrolase-like protein with peptidoglycan-binding domain